MTEEIQINRKTISIGEVAYYIKNTDTPYKYTVHWGIVEEHYHYEVVLQLYEQRERRLINGIPYNDFPNVTEWKKLPKGWTYSTNLYTFDFEPIETDKHYYLSEPDDLKRAIADGELVKVREKQHTHIDVEIDSKKGYRLVKKSKPYSYHQDWVSKPYMEIYATYEEAWAKIKEIEAEFKRQAELSDYDWSVEQIDKTISRAVAFSIITEDQAKTIRDRLLAMDNVEDIVIRIHNMAIQWRYEKNKRWIAIEL